MHFFHDGDDDENNTPAPPIVNHDPDSPGPEAGDYSPPEDMPIPGEGGVDDSQMG